MPNTANAQWIRVAHVRRQRFRPVAVLELLVAMAVLTAGAAVLTAAMVILAILTGGISLTAALSVIALPWLLSHDVRGTSLFGVWLYDCWQELHIERRDGTGAVLSEQVLTPSDAAERDRAVAHALEQATDEGRLVHEVLGEADGGGQVWFGGHPFLLPPAEEPLDRLIDALPQLVSHLCMQWRSSKSALCPHDRRRATLASFPFVRREVAVVGIHSCSDRHL